MMGCNKSMLFCKALEKIHLSKKRSKIISIIPDREGVVDGDGEEIEC